MFRGFVYKKNDSLPCGKVAYADGVLVFRPLNFDKEESGNRLIMVLDNKTLEVCTIQHFNCKILLHVLPFTRIAAVLSNLLSHLKIIFTPTGKRCLKNIFLIVNTGK